MFVIHVHVTKSLTPLGGHGSDHFMYAVIYNHMQKQTTGIVVVNNNFQQL